MCWTRSECGIWSRLPASPWLEASHHVLNQIRIWHLTKVACFSMIRSLTSCVEPDQNMAEYGIWSWFSVLHDLKPHIMCWTRSECGIWSWLPASLWLEASHHILNQVRMWHLIMVLCFSMVRSLTSCVDPDQNVAFEKPHIMCWSRSECGTWSWFPASPWLEASHHVLIQIRMWHLRSLTSCASTHVSIISGEAARAEHFTPGAFVP